MALSRPLKLFVSYAHDDRRYLDQLDKYLAQLQRENIIELWHDPRIKAGDDWQGSIEESLSSADLVILLVSASFLASSFCNDRELKLALERHESGEARVIPVILKTCDWESSSFAKLQALPERALPITKWSPHAEGYNNVAKGIREIAEVLTEKPLVASQLPNTVVQPGAFGNLNSASSTSVHDDASLDLDVPEGPVRIGSPFYVHPSEELRIFSEIDKPGALIRLKSPKGFGKTSLLARIKEHANSMGSRTALLDLKAMNKDYFEDPNRFMQWFCMATGRQLGIRERVEDFWEDFLPPNDNADDYLQEHLLRNSSKPLLLAIDNFDRVFSHVGIESDFSGLLRSWHEKSRSNQLWGNLRLVIAHAQEPYLARDINQSPFNVGLPVKLGEFSPAQIIELLKIHRLDLLEASIQELVALIGGHPQLVRKALYALSQGLELEAFMQTAATEAGLYADHLRGLLKAVEDSDLVEPLRRVMGADQPIGLRSDEAFKLDSLGLVVPVANQVKPRCVLYRLYFKERLGI